MFTDCHLWEWEVWPRGWASGNSVIGAPILMYFSDIVWGDQVTGQQGQDLTEDTNFYEAGNNFDIIV